MEAVERKATSIQDVINVIYSFVSDNSRNHDVKIRWLSDQLKETMRIAQQVRNNSLDEVLEKQVAEFRCAEIEQERLRRQREIEKLDREEALVKAKIEKSAA